MLIVQLLILNIAKSSFRTLKIVLWGNLRPPMLAILIESLGMPYDLFRPWKTKALPRRWRLFGPADRPHVGGVP
jgi:hypothetical protein